MIQLTKELTNMIAAQQGFIGTTVTNGRSRVASRNSGRVWSDGIVIFIEETGETTILNNEDEISLIATNRLILDGSRLIGTSELMEQSELYETAASRAAETSLPDPPLQ